MNVLRKLVLMSATVLLSCGVANIEVAQAGSLYKLTFHNRDNVVVGEGSFEISDIPFEVTVPNSPFPPFTITAADQLFLVTNFSVTVNEKQWDLSNLIYDFGTEPASVLLWTLNSLTQPRSLTPLYNYGSGSSPTISFRPELYPLWYFAKGAFSVDDQFFISAALSGDRMVWNHSGFIPEGERWARTDGGHVTATAIPEPMTIAGLALASAGLAATRRRLAMSKR